jgi:hypothetical protein
VAAGAKQRQRRAAGVVAASVLAHVGVLAMLFSHFGSAPNSAAPPVMSVELVTRAPAAETTPAHKAPRRPGALRTAAPPQEIVLHPTPPTPDHVAPSAVAGHTPGDVQATLRGLVGCSPAVLAHLSREQREACEQRLAARQVADLGRQAGRLNLDLTGAFGKNPQAILERRPTNGCRARAGGDVAPMGEIGVAGGVACAKPF